MSNVTNSVSCQHPTHLPNLIHPFIFFLENDASKYIASPLVRSQTVSTLDFTEHKLKESRDEKQRENKQNHYLNILNIKKKSIMKYFFDIYSTAKVVFHHLEPIDL